MKRLLLISILLPVILLGHLNAQVVSDSAAVHNLRRMAAMLTNDSCARVAEIRLDDNGLFTTTFVFYHGISASDTVYFTRQKSSSIVDLKVDEPTTIISSPKSTTQIADKPVPNLVIEPLKEEPIADPHENSVLIPLEYISSLTFKTELKQASNFQTVGAPDVVVRASHESDSLLVLDVSGLAPLNVSSKSSGPTSVIIPDIVIRPARDSDILASTGIAGLTEIPNVRKPPSEIIPTILPDILHSSALDTVGELILDAAAFSQLNLPVKMQELSVGVAIPDVAASGALDTVGAPELDNAAFTSLAVSTSDITVVPVELPLKLELRTVVDDMYLSPDGYALLEKMEGFAPTLYNLGDGGYTIGFGFFVPFNEGYKWKNGVTWEQAVALIAQKVPTYEDQVKKYINVPLTQSEFDALTMLAYNIGGFSKATSLINDINEQVDIGKIQNDWNRFIHSKAPNVTKGLMKRRKDEIEVRKLSDYQPTRKIQILKGTK